MKRHAHRIGAVFYALWGIVHIYVGALMLSRLAAEGGTGVLAVTASAVPVEELPQNLTGVAAAVLGTHAWNLGVFGTLALVVAMTLNWRNSRIGYWLNLGVVSADDVGFFYVIVLPGYIRLGEGLLGPVLYWPSSSVLSGSWPTRTRHGGHHPEGPPWRARLVPRSQPQTLLDR